MSPCPQNVEGHFRRPTCCFSIHAGASPLLSIPFVVSSRRTHGEQICFLHVPSCRAESWLCIAKQSAFSRLDEGTPTHSSPSAKVATYGGVFVPSHPLSPTTKQRAGTRLVLAAPGGRQNRPHRVALPHLGHVSGPVADGEPRPVLDRSKRVGGDQGPLRDPIFRGVRRGLLAENGGLEKVCRGMRGLPRPSWDERK